MHLRNLLPMRVAITGIAGFIGSHLAAHLSDRYEVIGFDNGRSGDFSRVPKGSVVHRLDIKEPSAEHWAQHLGGVDVLFHLAAEKYNSSKSTPAQVIETNVSATARMLQGASSAGVKQVVFTSSLYAYGSIGPEPMRERQPLTPDTYYGMSKVAGENLLRVAQRDHGLRWAVARLFFVYGPNQYAEGGYKSVIMTNFERMLAGEPPHINGDGKQRLDYVYVEDAVEALEALSSHDAAGLTVNIGSGIAPSILELTAQMQRIAGSNGASQHVAADWTQGTIRMADPSAADKLLGWRARTDIESGLQEVWNWLRTRG